METNLFSSKDSKETRPMYTTSNNIEIMIGYEIGEIIGELFESLLKIYQEGLKKSMKGSEFVYDSIDLLYYKHHKTSLNRGGSYIDSPEWLKNKQATISPNYSDNKCFQYAVTVALNHEQIKTHLQRITKIRPFTGQYKLNEIEFPSHKKDWNKFKKNNKTIAVNVLFVQHNTKQIRPAYVSKYNSDRKNQVVLLMITDNNKWHYLFVKKYLHCLEK